MKLLKMDLMNFRGVKHFVFEPQGKNCTVRGQNGTGKTSLYDALCWLLFGKDSRGQADFSVKTLNEAGAVLAHGLDHSVECSFLVDDLFGRTNNITLKRTLTEKWVKARGRADAEFSGHTVSYFIDGVPKKEGEYKDFINDICDEERFRLLTNPLRFAEDEKRGGIGWKRRREILHELKPITDEDVIDSDPELRPLTDLLKGKTPDEYKAIVKARQAAINKELPLLPARIDELTRTLDAPGDQQELSEKVELLRKGLIALKIEQVTIRNGGQVAELARQLAEVEQKILEATGRDRQMINQQIMDFSGVIDGLLKEACSLARQQEEKEATRKSKEREVALLQGEIAGLQGRFNQRRQETQPETCDKCGQPMPADSLAAWNKLKSDDLLKILEQVEGNKKEITRTKGALEEIGKEASSLAEKKEELHKKIEAEKEKIEALRILKIQAPPELEEQRIQLADKIDLLKLGNGPALAELQEKIDKIETEITTINQQVAALNEADKNKARIQELKAQEKVLAGEYDRLSQHLFLLEEFTRAKVRATEGPINDMFGLAKFKMFEEQINGGLADCCEVTYQGVPFTSDLNRGHQIKVGMDIILTLQRHYQFTPVLFIDNAEGVDSLPEMDCQVIKLVMDADVEKLTVEL